MHPCCFCFQPIVTQSLTVVIVATDRFDETDARRQAVWSHPVCLGERLAGGVTFDAEGFFD